MLVCMYGPGYRGACQKGEEDFDTLQAAEPPCCVNNHKWSLGLIPFGLKSLVLMTLVIWPNFLRLSVSDIGHLA